MTVITIEDIWQIEVVADKTMTMIEFIQNHGASTRIEIPTSQAKVLLDDLAYSLRKV